MNPPAQIGQADLIAYLVITEDHKRTGNTEHIVDGLPTEDFYGLAICKYKDDPGYYLFYCDASWETITDTYHDTVEDAKDQAAFEYSDTEKDWVHV